MKLFLEPIDVDPPRGRPRRLRWRRRMYAIREIIDFWVSQTHWWRAEERREYLRVLTDDGVFELYRSAGRWTLSRVMD
jgi:hypothetical protein